MPLTGSVLSIWLSEAGYSKSLIGAFSLLSIPFSFKILWILPIDYLIPSKWKGRERKFWLLFGLVGMILSLLGLSHSDPTTSPWMLGTFLVLISCMAGCVYIAGIAYELEGIDEQDYRLGSAWVITGYRIGLLTAGAGALYLSSFFGWDHMLRCMATLLVLAALVIVFLPEPYKSQDILAAKRKGLEKYSSAKQAFFREVFWEPCKQFFIKDSPWKILFFIFFIKFGDELLREMSGPFYLSMGFDKIDLANAGKVWGMIATIAGAFLAAIYMKNKDYLLIVAGMNLIHACAMICFIILSIIGKSYLCLYASIAIENLTGGMVTTAFIAFLWRICDKKFAAIQYALLWSAFLFKSRLVSCLGGMIADLYSWTTFFILVTCISITAAYVAMLIAKKIAMSSQMKPAEVV